MAYECQIWSKNFLFKKQKKKTNKNYHGPWVPNLPRFIYNEIRICFGSPIKTFPLEIVELIEKLEGIKKNIRPWGCENSRFRVMAFFYFLQNKHLVKKLLYHIVAMIVLKRFRIVTHCCTASFSIKTFFCKTNNIFYSLENRIWDKTK